MRVINGLMSYKPEALVAVRHKAVFLFTGNSTLKRDGALVMGRGAALEVRDTYEGIDQIFGQLIRHARKNDKGWYGVVWQRGPYSWVLRSTAHEVIDLNGSFDESVTITTNSIPRTLGCFQVKEHFKDRANPFLIEYSAMKLGAEATCNPDVAFYMNYPGIGWGHLTEAHVEHILRRHLPDNVHLFKEQSNGR